MKFKKSRKKKENVYADYKYNIISMISPNFKSNSMTQTNTYLQDCPR